MVVGKLLEYVHQLGLNVFFQYQRRGTPETNTRTNLVELEAPKPVQRSVQPSPTRL